MQLLKPLIAKSIHDGGGLKGGSIRKGEFVKKTSPLEF